MMSKSRFLIIEDVPALREHAKTVLAALYKDSEIHLAENGADGVRMAMSLAPQFIIMDISMPEMNGIKAAEQIWSNDKNASILFWSQYHRETYVRSLGKIVPDEAIHGYLLKSESSEKLAEAVNKIVDDQVPYIDPVVQRVQSRLKSKDQTLTDSEYETLLDITVGLTDRAIAARRHISVRGVQNRLSMLLNKLVKEEEFHLKESCGMEIFNPRTRIVFHALQRGLIDPDELSLLDEEALDWVDEEYDIKS
ncbi:MAG: response regulator transcription factor [Candidatus Melainabacteria bacterium]|nr:response regulator transcription factor [Candidatus Melainabacteria bacterium]